MSCYKILIKDVKRENSEFVNSPTARQRLFMMVFPYGFTLYQKGKEENNPQVKEFFTAVIMYLITQIPFKIVKSSFQKVLPIILENILRASQNFDGQLDNMVLS